MYCLAEGTAATRASRAAASSSPDGRSTTPVSVTRALAGGSGSGATITTLARWSAARLRPCSARFETHSTGAPFSSPKVTNDAHGSPVAVSVASVPAFVDAAVVRAATAADWRDATSAPYPTATMRHRRRKASNKRFHRRMAGSMRESHHDNRLVSNYFVGNEEHMGVSVLRVMACAGVLVGGLMLGTSASGLASA